jgi:hypothetical protein
MADLQQVHALIQELQAEVARQRDQIAHQHGQILVLEAIKAPTPKARLPDPEKFNGQTLKYNTWLPLIKAKLRVGGNVIRDSIA